MSNLSNNIHLFQEKYNNFIQSRDEFLKKNNELIEKTKKFVSLGKNVNVTKDTMGASNPPITGIVTKDGMFIGSAINTMDKNEYCKLSAGNTYSETNHLDFDPNNKIFYAERNIDFSNKPCNTFNELVQVGLQDFSFNDTSQDTNSSRCIATSGNDFDTGSDPDFKTIKIDSNRCEKNHYEICQSMAKFKSIGEQKYYGIGEKDDSCHCYISTSDKISSNHLTGKDKVEVIPTNNFDYTGVKMLALMKDGSLMTFKSKNLENTHDGLFNMDEKSEQISDLGPINPSCNPYVGSGPSNLQVTWDPFFECKTNTT